MFLKFTKILNGHCLALAPEAGGGGTLLQTFLVFCFWSNPRHFWLPDLPKPLKLIPHLPNQLHLLKHYLPDPPARPSHTLFLFAIFYVFCVFALFFFCFSSFVYLSSVFCGLFLPLVFLLSSVSRLNHLSIQTSVPDTTPSV